MMRENTGYKDKQENDIFVDDIIELAYSDGHERDSSYDYHGKYLVEKVDNKYKLKMLSGWDGYRGDGHKELALDLECYLVKNKGKKYYQFEVIGNKIDNPELLDER